MAGTSLVPCPPLFPDESEAALRIFKSLRIVDAPGSPTMGEACAPWIFDFVAAIFGAYDPETGRRLINEFFLLISKKNAKSTIAAGIMLTALLMNWRLSAELVILAPTIEVAQNSAKPAMDMVKADPELMELLKPVEHLRTIEHRTTGATLKIIAADSDTASGKKASVVLIDELWAFGNKASAENMLREACGGLASRPEGFVIALSTHSDKPPAGVFAQWLRRFRKIRSGELVAPKSMGILYEFPPAIIKAKGYLQPENFFMTNPNLGRSVDEEFLLVELEKAQEKGDDSVAGFLAKHLNVEIGLSLSSDRWAGADLWERRADPSLTLDELIRRSEVICIGIDGGGLDDLLGLAVLGRERGTDKWLLWTRAYVAPIGITRRKSETTRYQGFVEDGDLVIVPDLPDDIKAVVGVVEQIKKTGLLSGVGVDQIGIGGIVDALAKIDVTQEEDNLVGVSQGWRLSGAIKTTERKLADGTFVHAGQPLMAYAVGNAKVEPRGNAVTITKQSAGNAKIDPLVATFNAVSLMERNPVVKRKSVYETKRPTGFLEI